MTIGELFIELGFHADTMKLKDFMHAVGELNMSSIATALGLGTLYEATNKIMNIAGDASENLRQFGDITGLDQQKMERFGKAAEQMGVQFKTSQGFINGLQDELVRLKAGQGNVGFWQTLGIENPASKDAFQIADEISKKLSNPNMDQGWKKLILSLKGFNPELLLALQHNKQFLEIQSKIDVESKYERDTLNDLRRAWVEVGQEWGHALLKLAVAIAPALRSLAEFLTSMYNFIKASKEAQFALTALFALFITSGIVGSIETIIGAFNALKVALIGLSAASWASGLAEVVVVLSTVALLYRQILEYQDRLNNSKSSNWQKFLSTIPSLMGPVAALVGNTMGGSNTHNTTNNIYGVEDTVGAAEKLSQQEYNINVHGSGRDNR